MTVPTEFLTQPNVVMLDLDATSGEAAVQALHARLATDRAAVVDEPQFLADLLGRMRLASVCLAADIALPHARTDAVARMVFAAARLRDPVAFDAEHPAVRLVFLIGTPKREVGEYLKVVAALSRQLRNPAVRSGLLATKNETEFRTLLAGGAAAK